MVITSNWKKIKNLLLGNFRYKFKGEKLRLWSGTHIKALWRLKNIKFA